MGLTSEGTAPESRPPVLVHPDGSQARAGSGNSATSDQIQRWLRRAFSPLLRDGIRPVLMCGDVGACVVAAILASASLAATLTVVGLTVLLQGTAGLYRSRLHLSVLDDLPRVLGRWFVTVAVLLVLALTTSWVGSEALTLATALLIALVLARASCYALVRSLRRTGVVSHPTLIVGTGKCGNRVAQVIREHPEYGLRFQGFLTGGTRPAAGDPVRLLGHPERFTQMLEESGAQVVVLAYGELSDRTLVGLIRACHRSRSELFLVPRLYEVHQVGDDMEMVWGMPLVRLRRSAGRSASWRLKRLIDVVLSGVALALLSPVLAACAVAVRLETGPGVLFRQQRVGMDGVMFELLKFRSLRPVDETESQTRWNIALDERLGRVGRFLRTSSLDELPQLFNILRGDMSLVGPRPERPEFVDDFTVRYSGYVARHRVPSGLTGWAQVHGLRGDTSIDDRAVFDNFYIENWSLWLDLKILLRTVVSVVTKPGA